MKKRMIDNNELNNKGIAISGIMYLILFISLLLIVGTLKTLQNRKTIMDKLKTETVDALECKNYSDLVREISDLKTEVETLKNTETTSHSYNTTCPFSGGNEDDYYYYYKILEFPIPQDGYPNTGIYYVNAVFLNNNFYLTAEIHISAYMGATRPVVLINARYLRKKAADLWYYIDEENKMVNVYIHRTAGNSFLRFNVTTISFHSSSSQAVKNPNIPCKPLHAVDATLTEVPSF